MTQVSATYRLQFHAGFTFDDAAPLAPYLRDLGVSHVYCSPYLQAAAGSTHGYDVVDHRQPNRELGGEAGLARFVAALTAHQLGQVLDIVPNHMAISTAENRWWMDVLENGPSSRFASYFDVDWSPPEARLRDTVLIPVLADHYGRILEAGELTVRREGGRFRIAYGDHLYPVGPRSLGRVLGPAARLIGSDALAFLADAFTELPLATATDRASVRRRHRDSIVLQAHLERVIENEPMTAAALDTAVTALNADREALHQLLELQNYRLAWWRSAGRDLGYRRFFDINTLIGLRMEDEQVFEETHQRVLEWVRAGAVDGLRIDHPDGLRDPAQYVDRLRAAASEAWLVLEKILEPGETLPERWPVAGTTGYDFLNRVAGLFVDPGAEGPLTEFYRDYTGATIDYPRLVQDQKLYVLREMLGSDVNRLTDLLLEICEQHPRHRDYSRHQLTEAIRALVASFPVYRTYIQPHTGQVDETDRRQIDAAVTTAMTGGADVEAPLLEFVRDLLTLKIAGVQESEFVARFQQLTGPTMAKGLEDTVFYTYNRFIGLNEVGGDPSRFGVSVEAFHDATADVQARWPQTMVTTATHDTKRGEDVRARLAVLSEQPDRWIDAVRRWSAMTVRHHTGDWPDRNLEYFFYQTLVGVWPVSVDRLTTYIEKATREAKTHTTWTSPNVSYDAAVRHFVEGCLSDPVFMADVERFVTPLVEPGWINSLAQTLLKMTVPGVPDLYQGTELWSFHLVDPDNRGAVDYDERRRALAAVQALSPHEIWQRAGDGLPKLWTVFQALQVRRRRPETFGPHSGYRALHAAGALTGSVVAFQRGADVVTVVPRLGLGAGRRWEGTTLTIPDGRWHNVLTARAVDSGAVDLADLWYDFPVALLERI